MARKVSVGLEADVAGFLGPVLESARATEKLDDKVDELDRSLNKIPADALKAGAALKLLKGDVKDVGTNFEAIGDKSTAMTVLDQRIRNTRTEVKKLTEEFVKTGDVDVFHRLNRSSGDLSALTNFRKTLSNSVETGIRDGARIGGRAAATESANTFAQLFQGGIIKALMNPYILVAVANIAAPLAAMLASAIGGAIIAVGAITAVGAGVAGAAMANPKAVGDAWTTEIDRIKKRWLDASQSFVGPTIAAIHTLGGAVDDMHIDRTLERASGFVAPLAQGVAGAMVAIGRGVDALIDNAGPIIDVLKSELPEVGRAIEMMFKAIAGGSGGAADGLRDVLHIVEALIVGLGVTIGVAEGVWHAFHAIVDALGNAMQSDVLGWFGKLNAAIDPRVPQQYAVSLDGAAHGLDKVATAEEKAEKKAAELKTQIGSIGTAFSSLGQSVESALTSKILDSMFALDHAALRFAESLNSVTQSAKENGRALSGNSEKALKNKEALLSAAEANASLYAQNLLSGDSAAVAAGKYANGAAQLRKQAIAAGFNAKEVDGLIGKYGKVPERVQTILATIGLTDALNKLGQILIDFRNLNNKDFKTKYTVTYTVNHVTHYDSTGQPGNSRQAGNALGGIRHAATGMIVAPSNPGTLIGEPQTGGEALIPLRGITQARAMGLMRTAGAGYGLEVGPAGSRALAVTFNFVGHTDSALANWFMKAVRKGEIQIGVS